MASLAGTSPPDEDAADLDTSAIAAAMGFSSFGTQAHPSKKRRFNPHLDAMVAVGRGVVEGGRGGVATQSSTLGTLPQKPAVVPTPTRKPPSSNLLHPSRAANIDEIHLDDDDNDDDPAPQYIDTSRPVGETRYLGEVIAVPGAGAGADTFADDAAAQQQARIDAILAAGHAAYGEPSMAPPGQLDGSTLSAMRRAHHGDVDPGAGTGASASIGGDPRVRSFDRHGFRPELTSEDSGPLVADHAGHAGNAYGPRGYGHGHSHSRSFSQDYRRTGGSSEYGSSFGGGSFGGGGGGAGRLGRPSWWIDYYDPTTNENPWVRIEADRGLSSCGRWLARDGPAGPQATAAVP